MLPQFFLGEVMPYTVNIEPAAAFIEIQYVGQVTNQDLESAFRDAVTLANEHQIIRFLADCSSLTGGHSIVDLYAVIDLFEAHGLERNVKEAIVMPIAPDRLTEVRFYETACRNRGYNARIFPDRASAADWLSQ